MEVASLDDEGASVAVHYKALPKDSKLYLEKVLQDWLAWHRRSYPVEVALTTSIPVVSGALEFTPSVLPSEIVAGPLAWVDKPSRSTSPQHPKRGFNLSYEMVGDVPKYDCSSERPLDAQDAERRAAERIDSSGPTKYVAAAPRRSRPRCFNCGSYYHALRDCLLSKDADAISRARSEHQGNRGTSVSGRYFLEASAAGAEFSDLQPGVLSEELRAAMGLKPEDPPPWLFRMRQMGYPPGYRRWSNEESDDEVVIIGDDGTEQDALPIASVSHNGDSSTSETEELVAFPGLNAPIPATANPAVWFGQPAEPLVNGMIPEERGFKRSRSGGSGGGESVEHAAKRARFWEANPLGMQYAASTPLQQVSYTAYGLPSYAPYTPMYPHPPAANHPYTQQPPAQSSQQWAPANPQPLQSQPPLHGVYSLTAPPPMHPTFAPLPAAPQATPQNGAPAQGSFQQLPGGFQGGFPAAAPGAYLGGPAQTAYAYAYSAAPTQPYPYQHQYNTPVPQQQLQQPQQQQGYDNLQWAVHSMQFQSLVEKPPPPPPG
ncbi:hypothetical protein COCSUDRAFT_44093 [Coccomyxa subellipsoidea C-169]|uniref:PSP proline-rich domain-containing protein n=1 Tax=Coccomyxa subellipsoidea (strain C-169) TaxID=574566 RepID=I0YP06_COCSC|nr:hypothetical protein COCSUDRAFT_44093 [Coccomyxa subellipsoidea C-169]EIE20125.1 hypothetical protein COCSUDRAFT_44093 [Coccomyxa subellipsoidea C-169]|eukprot:XP_005644669.1 hypothetical protein COCSUDRAFT_44093 [Coccomyxa subellipsoidea C-169]